MTPEAKGRSAHSIFEQLKKQARERNEDMNLVLQRYGVERLLYRLSISRYRDMFLLKGASLIMVWLGKAYRSTRDIDLLGYGPPEAERITVVFAELCNLKVEIPDGVEFNPDSIVVEPIREEKAYGGQRVRLQANLHSARLALQIDLGFGDAVTPEPEEIEYPVRLDLPAPRVLAYPKETVVAEKLEAMVSLGMANSRLKDFYDIWLLSRKTHFDGRQLKLAVRATFDRRRTVIPTETPLALADGFSLDSSKQAQWKAFITRHEAEDAPGTLAEAVTEISRFAGRVLEAASTDGDLDETWNPESGWSRR